MEKRFAPHRIMAFYIAGGLSGNLAAAALAKPDTMSVGSSGAIYSMLTFAVAIDGMFDKCRRRFVAAMLCLALGNGFFFPHVDNWCHLGGAAFGLATWAVYTTIHGGSADAENTSDWFLWRRRILLALRAFVVAIFVVGVALCAYSLHCSSCVFKPPGQVTLTVLT